MYSKTKYRKYDQHKNSIGIELQPIQNIGDTPSTAHCLFSDNVYWKKCRFAETPLLRYGIGHNGTIYLPEKKFPHNPLLGLFSSRDVIQYCYIEIWFLDDWGDCHVENVFVGCYGPNHGDGRLRSKNHDKHWKISFFRSSSFWKW